jgi:hypothetical protein
VTLGRSGAPVAEKIKKKKKKKLMGFGPWGWPNHPHGPCHGKTSKFFLEGLAALRGGSAIPRANLLNFL